MIGLGEPEASLELSSVLGSIVGGGLGGGIIMAIFGFLKRTFVK
jgi:hypothetical protein